MLTLARITFLRLKAATKARQSLPDSAWSWDTRCTALPQPCLALPSIALVLWSFCRNFQAGFVFREAPQGSVPAATAQSDMWRLAAGRVVYRE